MTVCEAERFGLSNDERPSSCRVDRRLSSVVGEGRGTFLDGAAERVAVLPMPEAGR